MHSAMQQNQNKFKLTKTNYNQNPVSINQRAVTHEEDKKDELNCSFEMNFNIDSSGQLVPSFKSRDGEPLIQQPEHNKGSEKLKIKPEFTKA
jgi:hypothetical protein